MSNSPFALGIGLGSKNSKGQWLDSFYPQPLLEPTAKLVEAIAPLLKYSGGNRALELDGDTMAGVAEALKGCGDSAQAELAAQLASSQQALVVTILASDEAPSSLPE